MKLSDWLEGDESVEPPRPKMTHAEFGRRIDCPQPTVTRYAKGERIPEPERMERIFRETGGAVTPNDFYPMGDAPAEDSAPAAVAGA